MCASMADIQFAAAEIRRGKKEGRRRTNHYIKILERGPMPNVIAALPNVGGALCSTLQSFWLTPTTTRRAVTLPRRDTN